MGDPHLDYSFFDDRPDDPSFGERCRIRLFLVMYRFSCRRCSRQPYSYRTRQRCGFLSFATSLAPRPEQQQPYIDKYANKMNGELAPRPKVQWHGFYALTRQEKSHPHTKITVLRNQESIVINQYQQKQDANEMPACIAEGTMYVS